MSEPNVFDDALIVEKAWGTPFGEFVKSIYKQESGGGKNTKTSNQGAVGGMQILPGTFKEVADKGWDIGDSFDNARAGIRYAKKMWDMAGGDPKIAAAGYYGGPGGLKKAQQGIAVSDPKNPKAPNTLQYGEQVASRMAKASPAVAAPAPAAPTAVAAASIPAPVVSAPEASPVAELPPVGVADAGVYASNLPVRGARGPNAWQAFLEAMPKVPTGPVQPADLSFGTSPTLAKLTLPPSVIPQSQNRKPNFEAFQGWRGQA